MPELNPLIILFDLENTLVDSWENPIPLPSKIEYIRTILDSLTFGRSVTYGIFSTAIETIHEIQEGVAMAQQALPNLQFSLAWVPIYSDLTALCPVTGDLQKWEVMALIKKQGLIEAYTKLPNHRGNDFALFDDTLEVPKTVITRVWNPQHHQTLHLFKV